MKRAGHNHHSSNAFRTLALVRDDQDPVGRPCIERAKVGHGLCGQRDAGVDFNLHVIGQPPRHVRNIAVVSGLYRWNTVEFPSEAWCTFLQGGYCRRRGHVAGGWLRHHRAGSPGTRPAHRQAAVLYPLTYITPPPQFPLPQFQYRCNALSDARTIRRHHACFQRPVQTASVMIELLKGRAEVLQLKQHRRPDGRASRNQSDT